MLLYIIQEKKEAVLVKFIFLVSIKIKLYNIKQEIYFKILKIFLLIILLCLKIL